MSFSSGGFVKGDDVINFLPLLSAPIESSPSEGLATVRLPLSGQSPTKITVDNFN